MNIYGDLDLGVKSSAFCMVDKKGKLIAEGEIPTDEKCFERAFGGADMMPVVVERLSHKVHKCCSGHLGSHGERSRTMTKSLPHSRHPSTPLRMTTFVVLSNLLLRQPLEACPLVEWACQFLEKLGHEAVIIDARQAKAVVRSKRKTDKIDAHKLALLRVWDEVTRELHELTQRLEREVTQDKLCRHLMSAEEFEKETCWLKKD